MLTLKKSVKLLEKKHFLSIRAVPEFNIDKGSVRQILHEHCNLKCGRTARGFFTMTTHCLSRCFWRNTRSPCLNIHPTHLTLASCDFFFIYKDQVCIKRNPFQVRRCSEGKVTAVMKMLSEKDLQHCFQQWKIRMEWCMVRGGDHFEGDNISIV
jgi:hypothetical protein